LGFLLLLACARTSPPYSDIVYLKDGEELPGRLESLDTARVEVLTPQGRVELESSEIASIALGEVRPGSEWQTVSEITDPLLLSLIKAAPDEEAYPAAGYINLWVESEVRYTPEGFEERVRVVRKILNERGKRVANQAIYYLKPHQSVKLNFARTITPDRKVIHIRDAAIEEVSLHPWPASYDRERQVKFALPEARIGSILDYEYLRTQSMISPLHPGSRIEVFGDREPTLHQTFKVLAPPEMELAYDLEGCGEPAVRKRDGLKEYHWELSDLPRLEPELRLPPIPELLPRVIIGPAQSWPELDSIYSCVLEDSLTEDLSGLIDSLGPDPKRLYNFVAREIRPVEVDLDEYSYIPKSTTTILRERVGNDLDRSYLLYGLLRAAGYDPHLVLVRSQARGPMLDGVPSLGQFDRALLRLGEDWLSVESRRSFGDLPGEAQGVKGLLIGSKGKIATIPLAAPNAEALRSEFELWLEPNGDLKSIWALEYSGEEGAAIRWFKNLKSKEKEIEFQGWIAQLHPKAQLEYYELSDLEDLDEPVRVRLKYSIPGYAIRGGKEFLAFPLPGINYSAREVGKPERCYPMSWQRCELIIHKFTLHLPQNYEVYYLPDLSGFDLPYLSYHGNLQVDGTLIRFEDRYERRAIRILPQDYRDYKNCREAMARLAQALIVLKKIGG
jgi:hypothetical protein